MRHLSWSRGPPLCLQVISIRAFGSSNQNCALPLWAMFLLYCSSNGLSGRSFGYSSECARGQILFFFFFTPPRCIPTVLLPIFPIFGFTLDLFWHTISILTSPLFYPSWLPRFSHCQATLLAIRDVHKKLYPGIRESQARTMMASALGAAGLKDGGCLTLFGGA